MFFYLKALHIIFIVTWFAGMFYIVRLFIYNTEAQVKSEPDRSILTTQFAIMIKRLWFGITWPSAVLTLILGPTLLWFYTTIPVWLWIKMGFVVLLFLYHLSLHRIYREQLKGAFRYTSNGLRIWNEVATIFLVAIVMLVSVRSSLSWVWGLLGLFAFVIVLMGAIRIYKRIRRKVELGTK